ncbi:hypothetical protein DYH09_33455 [bacterium CPR1]|nr:hypothetical protein [bacterium CPR1]
MVCGRRGADQLVAGYRRGVAALESHREDLAQSRLGDLSELELNRSQMREDYQAVQEWLSRAVARCARCGEPGEYCQGCSLQGLVPDSQARPSADPEAMTPAMLILYQAATAVSAGLASAETLVALHEEVTLGAQRVSTRATVAPSR